MQDEPTSGMDAPKPEPTVADAFAEAKEAFAAAGSVIGANVKKAVKKARKAIRKATKKPSPEEGCPEEGRQEEDGEEEDREEGGQEARAKVEGAQGREEEDRPQEGRKGEEVEAPEPGVRAAVRGARASRPFLFTPPRAGSPSSGRRRPRPCCRSTSGRSSSGAFAVTKASALT